MKISISPFYLSFIQTQNDFIVPPSPLILSNLTLLRDDTLYFCAFLPLHSIRTSHPLMQSPVVSLASTLRPQLVEWTSHAPEHTYSRVLRTSCFLKKTFKFQIHKYYHLYLSFLMLLTQPSAPARVVTCAPVLDLPRSCDIPPLLFRMLTSSHHSRSSLRLSLPRKLPRLPHDSSSPMPSFTKCQKLYCVCY